MKIPSLVSVRWLAQALLKQANSTKSLSIVDGTWRIDGASVKARKDYIDKHIPSAVFFDIDECCDKTSKYQQMLPDQKLFAEYVKHLGMQKILIITMPFQISRCLNHISIAIVANCIYS
jgi:thiosulfate/3-mercaptopyruvate sulfurtransferase